MIRLAGGRTTEGGSALYPPVGGERGLVAGDAVPLSELGVADRLLAVLLLALLLLLVMLGPWGPPALAEA